MDWGGGYGVMECVKYGPQEKSKESDERKQSRRKGERK